VKGIVEIKTKEIAYGIVANLIDENKEQLMYYAHILAKANARARLTGSDDPIDIFDVHIKDCAMALPFLPCDARVVDVGTGGGLPGIVWAICRDDLSVVLLDSIRKKCELLSDMIQDLGLKNLQVCCGRVEEFALSNFERFDVAAARGVSHLGILLEYFSPLVRSGGKCLAFKGQRAFKELEEFYGEEGRLGWSDLEVWKYDLDERELFIFTWQKTRDAQMKLPRRVGIPEKRPWWR